MDDWSLSKLAVTPGTITPKFDPDIIDYSVSVSSDVASIVLTILTSDSGASYNIKIDGKGSSGKNVALAEGAVTRVLIEVTSEDGTSGVYAVNAKRFSGTDATLSSLEVVSVSSHLNPCFSEETLEYFLELGCDVVSLRVTYTTPDPKMTVTINDNDPKDCIPLNIGLTKIAIVVTSPDKTVTKMYIIRIKRRQIPLYVSLTSNPDSIDYECPISLAPLYCPIKIQNTTDEVKDSTRPSLRISGPMLDHIIEKGNKVNPIDGTLLSGKWRKTDFDMDSKLTYSRVNVSFLNGNTSEEFTVTDIGGKLEDLIENVGSVVTLTVDKYKTTSVSMQHRVTVRNWEKQLHQVYDQLKYDELNKIALEKVAQYEDTIDKYRQQPAPETFPKGESPYELLKAASIHVACAIKETSSNSSYHLLLGQIFEEQHYSKELYGHSEGNAVSLTNRSAGESSAVKESSMYEECEGICKLHGLKENASLPEKLKAIDKEYHDLLEAGQSSKADHVQKLFLWKSKQASQELLNQIAIKNEQIPLGKASIKYMDALVLDESKSIHHLNVGRMLFLSGLYKECVQRMEIALSISPGNKAAKFYLGISILMSKEMFTKRYIEAVQLLQESLNECLKDLVNESLSTKANSTGTQLFAKNPLTLRNSHVMKAFLYLGKMLAINPVKEIKAASPKIIFHNCCHLCSQALPMLHKEGDEHKIIESILIEAHYELIKLLQKDEPENVGLICKRCEYLNALTERSPSKTSQGILEIRRAIARILVRMQPCNSRALQSLADMEFTIYQYNPSSNRANLDVAVSFYKLSIELEGKPTVGEVPELIQKQKWFQTDTTDEAESEKQSTNLKQGTKSSSHSNKVPMKQTVPVAANQNLRKAKRSIPAKVTTKPDNTRKSNISSSGSRAKVRPGSKITNKKPQPKINTQKPTLMNSTPEKSAEVILPNSVVPVSASDENKTKSVIKTIQSKTVEAPQQKQTQKRPILTPFDPTRIPQSTNKKTYTSRLGLARVLSKMDGEENLEECKKYYHEVIHMVPKLQETYMEVADILSFKGDLKGAVGILYKYPFAKVKKGEENFDDAAIYGQILQLLMKIGNFKEPQLAKYMIAYAKILGVQAIAKYSELLEDKFETELLKKIYAGIHDKNIDDPDMVTFFKYKCW